MKKKQGISLIVLVITIIVMIILAAAVVVTLNNTGVIDKASYAVQLTDEKQAQDLAALIWAETYLDEDRTDTIEKVVKDKLKEQGITDENWNIDITNTGVTVSKKEDVNNSGGNDSSTNNTITISMGDESYFAGATHLEDRDTFDPTNYLAPYNTTMCKQYEYDPNMTWREWVASPYNIDSFTLYECPSSYAHEGYREESIVREVASNSYDIEGFQLTIAGVQVFYEDEACTQLAINETNIEGDGKISFIYEEYINLDEKIGETLNRISVETGTELGKYYKKTYLLAFTYFAAPNF
ncbi:MAG: type II secretion system protein [Clostridia bacterium]|nr:type II secretion system protein [Clostridia bacterium]